MDMLKQVLNMHGANSSAFSHSPFRLAPTQNLQSVGVSGVVEITMARLAVVFLLLWLSAHGCVRGMGASCLVCRVCSRRWGIIY